MYNRNMDENRTLSIKETSEILQCNINTVRNYLRLGYVPNVRINKNRHRILQPWQVDLLAVLLGMKQAGFTSKQIRQYSRLFRQGKRTEKQRLAMLTTHKHQLRNTIESCEKAIDFIERQEEIAYLTRR